jgi:histidine ammonia-lyase
MTVTLTGKTLTIDDLLRIARGGEAVALSDDARERVRAGERLLKAMIADGTPIYGITTGFGALDGAKVSAADNRALQRNLLKSHAASVGAPMARDTVRAMMAVRANVLASGATGVQEATLDALIAMLARDVVPLVPEQGSVGACGDLAPLAHMALPLIGLGRAWHASSRQEGALLPGAEAMARAAIALPDIAARDGIALINGTEQTTGIGALALADARVLVAAGEVAAALTLEALGGLNDAFDERVAQWKPHPGQIATSENLRRLTAGSASVAAPRPSRLRDALSLRCIPQVHGATRDAVAHAIAALEIEINAVNDNPLFGLSDGWVTSNSGNFHGQRAGEVLDFAAMSLTSLAVMSERRSARLVDRNHNGGLPAFLIHPQAPQGVNSGFMIAQYTAASLVAELRTRAVPASIQSVPTCANTEDHVPMAPIAARRAAFACAAAADVVAIELLLACQALDLRKIAPAPALAPAYRAIRAHVPVMVEDRVLADDIAAVRALVDAGAIA